MSWTIYYDNGTTVTDTDMEPAYVPPFGIQAIVQHDSPEGDKVITAGDDFYYWDERHQRWFGVELTGLWDYLIHAGFLKMGRFIPAHQYTAIIEKARAEING